MTRDEVKDLLNVMSATYPNYNPANKTMTVNVWFDVMQDIDGVAAMAALKAYIRSDRSGFAPCPAQIIGLLQDIATPQMNENEAWSIVRSAISDGIYHSQERFDKMPEAVQKAVGSPKQIEIWASDPEFNESVIQSNFMRSYRTETERAKKNAVIGMDLSELITRTSQSLSMQTHNLLSENLN